MSQAAVPFATAPPNSWHMIRTLGGIGILCALLIVVTYEATLPVITHNKAVALEKAIFKVLPGAARQIPFELTPNGQLQPLNGAPSDKQLIYVGYDQTGAVLGVAIEAAGQGFQETIRLLYGYSPSRQQVIGMEVLQSRETPGLGDKIMKDPAFLANFAALDVALNDSGSDLKHRVIAVKKGQKEHPWQVDGITGATISAKAVAAIIDVSARRLLPVLATQRLEPAP